MKSSVMFLSCLVLLFSVPALAEAPAISNPVPAPVSPAADEPFMVDFSNLYPDNPAATPVSVDPIDKPTPTPMPTPNFAYKLYENTSMGISFSIPMTWLLNPNTNQSSTVQFVEPQREMMDQGGYQTRLTIEQVNMGVPQTVSDARSRLESVLEEMANNFSSFVPGSIASASLGGAKGSYCYYKAEYNDGIKTYLMNGRITIVASGNSLYQMRITAPRDWYSYYENVFRRARSTWKFR
ncbi:MAG: hypothetical protein J6B53_01025 [Clostridia bacterium]|nr:hypothetical protein [Clostridia bacterium]